MIEFEQPDSLFERLVTFALSCVVLSSGRPLTVMPEPVSSVTVPVAASEPVQAPFV